MKELTDREIQWLEAFAKHHNFNYFIVVGNYYLYLS